MRYELAMYYNTPYSRPFHKMQGSMQDSGVAYAPHLDSSYDHAQSPHTGVIQEGSANYGLQGGSNSSAYYLEDVVGTADVAGRLSHNDPQAVWQPVTSSFSTRSDG